MSALSAQTAGTLERTPLGALLVHALDERLTGTLVFEEPNGLRHGVFFEAGKPSRARLSAKSAHLGEVLVESGALSSAACERTLERALAERVLHGRILLNEGLISEETLDQGLSEQLARQVSWLFGQPVETKYGYFADKNFLAHWGGPNAVRRNPLDLLWRGLRDHARSSEIEAALEHVVGSRVALIDGLPPEHFAFMGPERAIIERLRAAPQYVTDLIQRTPHLETSIKRVICFLILTRSMQLGYPTAPPAGIATPEPPLSIPPSARVPSFTPPASARAPSVAPSLAPPPSARDAVWRRTPAPDSRRPSGSVPALSARSASLREEARQRLERIGRGHYDVLGLMADASPAQVQAAFFRVAKRWHPDRLGAEATSLRDSATRIFTAATEANRILSDPELRREYDRTRAEGTSAQSGHEAMAKALAGEIAFQKAEAFLQRGNLEGARREAKLALEHDPERPEHLALHAWLAVLEPDADVSKIAVALSRARRAGANSPKVHFYAALVLKHLGRHASALREFRLVLEKEPRNIDAAREVRLYEIRLRNSPKDRPSLAPEPTDTPPSAWSRLLKRST
jgi:curved DNA-binding protein CbpA